MVIAEPEEGTLYAAALEVRHDCPVGNMSRKLPKLRILHWCPNDRDIFQVSGPEDQIQVFREWVLSGFGSRQVHATAEGVLLVTEACRCGLDGRFPATNSDSKGGTSVNAVMRSVGAWDIPPIVYREGWESWRVITMSEASLREMFAGIRRIGELRIVSMRPIENLQMEKMMLMPASDIFSGLTEKQSLAVLMGLRYGYYSTPSETRIERLAEGAGLSPSTLSEHMRKAEARILKNLRPYLEAYAMRTPGAIAVEGIRTAAPPRRRSNEAFAEAGS